MAINRYFTSVLGASALSFGAGALGLGSLLWGISKSRRLGFSSFKERVVLVTGSSRGLGLILARQLVEEGAYVVICARDQNELHQARQELELCGSQSGAQVLAVVCDVSDQKQVEVMIELACERFGRLDVVINNAGIIQVGPAEVMTEKDYHAAMDVNFWGAVNVTLAALPKLMGSGHNPRVVNIASIGGAVGVPHLIPYVSSKFALVGFSETLAAEVRRYGIRVVTVLPGLMRTGSYVNALFRGKKTHEMKWFSVAANLPLLTIDADRAARKIIEACRSGRPVLTVGVPAKFLRLFSALFPGVTVRMNAVISRYVLPDAKTPKPGTETLGAA